MNRLVATMVQHLSLIIMLIPAAQNIIWQHSKKVWRSTDGGVSWTHTAGLPNYIVLYPQYYWISGSEWPAIIVVTGAVII